ncbi:hypothetical protein JCM8097_003009 [Rhodosporidiobolus ruineniae]
MAAQPPAQPTPAVLASPPPQLADEPQHPPQPPQAANAPASDSQKRSTSTAEGDWVVVDASAAPLPPKPSAPPRSSFKGLFTIPQELVKPGMEMLKVSAKSARRVKPRRVWLELASETPDDGELGLEVGIGVVGGQDVRLCWEKNGGALGFARSSNYASVPLSRIRDLRFGPAGSPYRTSLHLPQAVEPRWLTVIYAIPPSSSLFGSPSYKLVHFIAPSPAELDLWQKTLEGFKEGRLAKGIAEGELAEPDHHEEKDKVVREEEVHQLCQRLGMGMSRAEISQAFRKSAAPNDHLDFKAFQNFVKLLKRRGDIEAIFSSVAEEGKLGIDFDRWSRFLADMQGISLDESALSRLFNKYASPTDKVITIDGFVSYLMSSDNAAIKDESKQDMSRPLPEYYISSSHNTYLIGNQFQGQSTVEGYIRALQQGCRSVEIDVWDGDDGDPVVTHGLTLTTKLPVRTVLHAIAQYAFLASPYPVILSLEVHCELQQQDKLASILHETLGDRLVSKRLDEMEADKDVERLPSPMDLRGKFLLKAKNKFITSNENGFPLKMVPAADDSSSSDMTSHSSSDSDFKNSKFYRAIRGFRSSHDRSPSRPPPPRSRSSSSGPVPIPPAPKSPSASSSITGSELSVSPSALPVSPPSYFPTTPPPLPTKPKDMAMSQSLANLLVYTIGVKARGFNKKEKYAATHVISLGESRVAKMLRDEGARQDFVAHNRGHLTRAYPKGSRLTSSNYAPHHMWAAGVQLVALNWQTFDVGMELNAAMFSRANRLGYVLKPEYLRQKGPEKDKIAALRSEKYRLEVEVISAQQLPRPRAAGVDDAINLDPFVEVSLFVPGVIALQKRRTPVVLGNAFNPLFRPSPSSTSGPSTPSSSSFSFTFSSHPSPGMLDLVFLRFEVLNAKGNVKAALEEGKGDSVGAYCISVGALMPGYRHVPLYDSIGDQHLFSTLFIKSKVTPLHEAG